MPHGVVLHHATQWRTSSRSGLGAGQKTLNIPSADQSSSQGHARVWRSSSRRRLRRRLLWQRQRQQQHQRQQWWQFRLARQCALNEARPVQDQTFDASRDSRQGRTVSLHEEDPLKANLSRIGSLNLTTDRYSRTNLSARSSAAGRTPWHSPAFQTRWPSSTRPSSQAAC